MSQPPPPPPPPTPTTRRYARVLFDLSNLPQKPQKPQKPQPQKPQDSENQLLSAEKPVEKRRRIEGNQRRIEGNPPSDKAVGKREPLRAHNEKKPKLREAHKDGSEEQKGTQEEEVEKESAADEGEGDSQEASSRLSENSLQSKKNYEQTRTALKVSKDLKRRLDQAKSSSKFQSQTWDAYFSHLLEKEGLGEKPRGEEAPREERNTLEKPSDSIPESQSEQKDDAEGR